MCADLNVHIAIMRNTIISVTTAPTHPSSVTASKSEFELVMEGFVIRTESK